MTIRRFNAITNTYKEIKVPRRWRVTTDYTDRKINCIHCSCTIKFENSFESARYKNEHNRGYRECATCFNNFDTVLKHNIKES